MSNEKAAVRPNGNKIRKLRKNKKWTQEDMEEAAGLSRKTISQVENGVPVSIQTLELIANALEVDYKDILSDDELLPQNAYQNLERYLYSFDAFIDEKVDNFTGRKLLLEKLGAFIDNPEIHSGYFVVVGDPGIGKSAILSKLIRLWCLPIHHFNISLQAINTPRQFLSNICVRLIQKFNLKHTDLPEDFATDGAFLNKILQEASLKLSKNDKLVIVIDALDEVEQFNNGITNPLFLPSVLPKNVYIVTSTRRVEDFALHASNLLNYDIDNKSRENLADIRAYIKRQTGKDGIKKWMEKAVLTNEKFVDVIAQKSEGNFMYLRCLLHSMAQSRFFNWTIDELPQGLRAYYRKHWEQMRNYNPSEFDNICRPIVCILAAVDKAVSAEQVARSSQVELTKVEKVLREWTTFIHKSSNLHQENTYRIYHSSFCDFLREEVDPNLKTYHAMIAKAALSNVEKRKTKNGND